MRIGVLECEGEYAVTLRSQTITRRKGFAVVVVLSHGPESSSYYDEYVSIARKHETEGLAHERERMQEDPRIDRDESIVCWW